MDKIGLSPVHCKDLWLFIHRYIFFENYSDLESLKGIKVFKNYSYPVILQRAACMKSFLPALPTYNLQYNKNSLRNPSCEPFLETPYCPTNMRYKVRHFFGSRFVSTEVGLRTYKPSFVELGNVRDFVLSSSEL